MKENNKIITGENSISQLSYILDNLSVKKFMLVCGKSFDKQEFKKYFDALTIPYVRFSDFTSNPLYESVYAGVELFKKEACDCLVAVGGGSAIDVAKCIKLFSKIDESQNYLLQEYVETNIPLIAIPTTAGTGSESNRHAVIYFEGKKQSISHDSLVPEIAILDSTTLKNLPNYHKKSTMLDALCQAIESWWSVNSTDESVKSSKEAIKLIVENWQDYLEGNLIASEKIMYAANLAGRAINVTQTTAPHAMSYELTSLYKIAHGHAVSLCLPIVWEYMSENLDKCIDHRGKKYLKVVLDEIALATGCSNVNNAILWFNKLMTELEMDKPKTQNVNDIEVLTASVNPVRLKNNPVALSEGVLREIYKEIVRIDK